jgi:superfamily II DNA or RNA helicase
MTSMKKPKVALRLLLEDEKDDAPKYIYLASSRAFLAMFLAKIGYSIDLYGRRSTYLTGCPPGLTPSYDMEYIGVWETGAATIEELRMHEDEIHNYLLKYRMMREIPGDSEWFNFQGRDPYEVVKAYVESRGWRQLPLSEIRPIARRSRYLQKQHQKNLQYITQRSKRNETLDQLQKPVICEICQFVTDPQQRAGRVICPCGSGKTRMTVKGISNVRRVIICCPSTQIQSQWYGTILQESIFSTSDIHYIGGAGTTDREIIHGYLQKKSYCIITTYASSRLLVDLISNEVELLIFDEAHHMAGIIAKEEKGEGSTRKLMQQAIALNIKRLSLTYTPRYIHHDGDMDYLTMDDETTFGPIIAELKIRNMIQKGVLPDYRLWTLRDDSQKGSGIIAKAECILEAWDATEMVRGEEKSILHHLIIFAATIQEAKELEQFFIKETKHTMVLRVEEGDKLHDPLAAFTAAPRAILINCFVLNEGIDIPIANAVAITYPKQSRGQITQMILRAGRWYEGKSLFHVLIPVIGDEDLSGFQEVLMALASCDDQIRDEILLRLSTSKPKPDPSPSTVEFDGTPPENIMMEGYDANPDEIKKCFTNICKNLFPSKDSQRIQELCVERGIDSSIDYAKWRQILPSLPEDPRPKNVTWFDYLHPACGGRISVRDFMEKYVDMYRLYSANKYEEWLEVQQLEVEQPEVLPSIQHINDGYFGKDYTNFMQLQETFGKKITTRGR